MCFNCMKGEQVGDWIRFHIPSDEVGVYSQAKAEWQFLRACEGDIDDGI